MEDSEEDQNAEKLTLQYLWNISRKINLSCPAASRYYMFNLKKSLDVSSSNVKEIKQHQFCKHCGNLWSSTNHKVKIQPPAKKNNHIKKLLKWEAEQPWKLNNRQKKKLLKYKESSNKIVYTCLCCKKTTEQPCFRRRVQTKEKMASLYTLPSKIKPKKRDLNALLLIHSQKSTILPDPPEKKYNCGKISDCNTKVINNSSSPASSCEGLKLTSNHSQVAKNSSIKNQHSSHNVSSSSNISKNKKKKKSLLAQILKQEQEAGRKKSSLSSFLISM